MRLRRVPGQIADEVPEGSSADSRQGSGGFRGRKLRLMRFRQVPGQMADEVPESSGQIANNFQDLPSCWGITHEFILMKNIWQNPQFPVDEEGMLPGGRLDSYYGHEP